MRSIAGRSADWRLVGKDPPSPRLWRTRLGEEKFEGRVPEVERKAVRREWVDPPSPRLRRTRVGKKVERRDVVFI